MFQKDWGGAGWEAETPQISVKSFCFEIRGGVVEFSKSKVSPEFQDHMLKS